MNYGDLVRNIDTNKSGVVVNVLNGNLQTVRYADGTVEVVHEQDLELNPTDELISQELNQEDQQ